MRIFPLIINHELFLDWWFNLWHAPFDLRSKILIHHLKKTPLFLSLSIIFVPFMHSLKDSLAATVYRLSDGWKRAKRFLKRHETVTNPYLTAIVRVPRWATWPNRSILNPDPSRLLRLWNQSSMCVRCVSVSYASREPGVIYQSRLGGHWENETQPDTGA